MKSTPSMDLESLEALQSAWLTRTVPGHRVNRISWSGGTTQVIEAGQGPPFMLIHGGLGEAFQWAPLLGQLSRHYHVLAVDRPGHGLADPFDYQGLNLLAFGSRFIRDVLDTLRLQSVFLAGNSMGGLWSVGFALEHPRRVQHLLLIGSPAGVQRSVPMQLRLGTLPLLRRAMQSALSNPTREGVRAFWKLLVTDPAKLENDFIDLSVASQHRNYRNWLSLIRQALDIRGMKPHLLLQQHWNHLRTPTTLIWGEQDAFSPPAIGDAIAAAHPAVRMVRVPNAGHAPWFDAPEAVAKAVELSIQEGRTAPTGSIPEGAPPAA